MASFLDYLNKRTIEEFVFRGVWFQITFRTKPGWRAFSPMEVSFRMNKIFEASTVANFDLRCNRNPPNKFVPNLFSFCRIKGWIVEETATMKVGSSDSKNTILSRFPGEPVFCIRISSKIDDYFSNSGPKYCTNIRIYEVNNLGRWYSRINLAYEGTFKDGDRVSIFTFHRGPDEIRSWLDAIVSKPRIH